MTHNRCVCRFHSFVLLVFSVKDRRMAELKMDNNDGNTVRPDPLYFFLEPQIRCLKTHWKRTGWNAVQLKFVQRLRQAINVSVAEQARVSISRSVGASRTRISRPSKRSPHTARRNSELPRLQDRRQRRGDAP